MRLEIIVFLIALAIFLYIKLVGKITIPKIGGVNRFINIINGAWVQTALLLLLFLLTLSYAVGGREEWKDSLRWWWNSKIFLPSLIGVAGTILFADAKWRKKINNTLIFATGAMILFSLIVAIPAVTDRSGGGKKDKTTKKVAAPSPPRKVVTMTVEVEKTKEETILAPFGDFEEVPLPPTEQLLGVVWDVQPGYESRCLVGITTEGQYGEQIFPCTQAQWFSRVVRLRFSSSDPLEGVPVKVFITYRTTEQISK